MLTAAERDKRRARTLLALAAAGLLALIAVWLPLGRALPAQNAAAVPPGAAGLAWPGWAHGTRAARAHTTAPQASQPQALSATRGDAHPALETAFVATPAPNIVPPSWSRQTLGTAANRLDETAARVATPPPRRSSSIPL